MTTAELVRPQIGLMLSCGEVVSGTNAKGETYTRPNKLDYIRAKPGELGQFAEAAKRFHSPECYGDRPRIIDVLFVSDQIGEVLDVRPKMYGTSGLRAVGQENLAAYPPGVFGDRIRGFDWTLTTFPEDKPEPGEYTLEHGRDDPTVVKGGLKVYGTLRVSVPKVTGLMLLTEISTTSVRTLENWHNGIHQALKITGGVLVGIPFKLILRPASSRYFDKKKGKRARTTFQEWVIESAHDLEELYAIAGRRRQALAGGIAPQLALPPVRHDDRDRDAELIAPSVEAEIVEAVEVPHVDVEVFEEHDGQGFSFDSLVPATAREETTE